MSAPPVCVGCDCPIAPPELEASAGAGGAMRVGAFVVHLCDECRSRVERRRALVAVRVAESLELDVEALRAGGAV